MDLISYSEQAEKLFKSKFKKNPKEVFKETIKLSDKGKLFADEVSKEFYSDKTMKKPYRKD